MIISRLSYAIGAWGNGRKCDLNSLQQIYNIIVRISMGENKFVAAKSIFEEYSLPNIKAIFAQKILEEGWHYYTSQKKRPQWYKLKNEEQDKRKKTRYNKQEFLEKPMMTNKYGERLPQYLIPKVWNFAVQKHFIADLKLKRHKIAKKGLRRLIETFLRGIQFDVLLSLL